MPIHCAKCGIANEDTMSFCQHCGTQLPQKSPYQPPAGWGQAAGHIPPDWGQSPSQSPSDWGQLPSSTDSPAPGRPLFGAGYDSPYPSPVSSPAAQQPSGSSSSAARIGGNSQTGKLSMVSMVMGIVVASLMLFGLIPCLGWINWFTLLVGGVSKLIGWISVFTEHKIPGALNKAIIGLVLTTIALLVGGIRLALGGGCL